MHVPARACRADGDHAVAPLADGERDRDIEIPVEAVALVEASDLEQDLTPRGRAVALDRFGFACRDLVEVLQVGGAKGPRSGETDTAVGERMGQRTKEIAGDLDRAIEHEDHAASRHANQCVAARALAQIAVGEVSLDAAIPRRDVTDPSLRLSARARIEDEDLAVRGEDGEHTGETAREIAGVLARDDP